MLNNFGTTEIIIVAILILIFFGGRKIPEFIRGVGEAVKEFRKGLKE